MLVTSMKTLAQVHKGALTAPYRAGLRSRTYRTALFNNPTTPPRVIPVTTVDGARLRVHEYGPADGQLIVLIHGWSCSIEYWNAQINAFADRYRVVAYDQRGHGESEAGTDLPETSTLADDLSTVLDAVLRPGEKAVLAGHSMGGITLQAWAARYPEQVRRRAAAVLLVNTTSGNIRHDTDMLPLLNKSLTVADKPVTLFGAELRMPAFLAESVLTAPVPLPGGWPVNAIFKNRVLSKTATADEVNFALNVVRSCRPLARGRQAGALVDMDLSNAAEQLTVPTTVIAGSGDLLLPERMSRPIVEVLSRTGYLVDYHVWPTGHLGNVETPGRFNTVLEAAVQSVTVRTAAAG